MACASFHYQIPNCLPMSSFPFHRSSRRRSSSMSISSSDRSRSRSRERKKTSSRHPRKDRHRSRSYSRSRSRSRSRDRRDRRSRSRDRKESSRRPPSSTPPPRFSDGDLIVLDFLEAEQDLVARMEEDKVRFMEDSTKHPDYRCVMESSGNSCKGKSHSQPHRWA